MRKILFAIPTLGGGGAERVLITLLNNLDKKKYDVTLFSVFDGGVNRKYLDENIKYHSFFNKTFRGNIHFFKLFSPRTLYNIMIKEEYDVAISYLEGPTTRIIGGCPYQNTKLVNWVHTETEKKREFTQSYRNMREMEMIYNQYDKTIFVSKVAEKTFKDAFPDIKVPMAIKYNTVDNNRIQELSTENKLNDMFEKNKVNLISVGRFTEQKGYKRLIRVINRLVKGGYKNIHLYLLGAGSLEKEYRIMVKKNNLENYITFLGFQENPYKYVRNADLFVCSSYREGFSTAVTESLIVGTPVITTLCSGMEEMLGANNEYGMIVENSEEALFNGLKKVLDNPMLIQYYERKAITRGQIFDLSKTVKKVEEILDL